MKRFLQILSILLLLHTCMPGHAQHELDSLTLKDLLNVKVTTASRTSQSADLASAVVTVITRDQIKTRNYRSLLDILFDLPDFKVDDKMYSGMRNSVTVRGTQGTEKFLVLMDGVNIGSPSGEAMPIMENYPVHFAEQVEILYGPASALYGADAVSGIINIITRKVVYKKLSTEIGITGGDYGYTNATLFATTKFNETTRLLVSGQYAYDKNPDFSKLYSNDSLTSIKDYSTGTLNTIYGPLTPKEALKPVYESPMKAYNIYVALRTDNFAFSVFRNYTRVPTSLGTNARNAIFNKDVYMGQSVTVANASFKKKTNQFISSSSITGSLYEMDPRSSYRNIYTNLERGYKYATTTMVRAEQQVDYTHSDQLIITAGSTFEHYNAVPQSTDLAGPVEKNKAISGVYLGTCATYRPDGLPAPFYHLQYYNVAGYAQTQYSPKPSINITAGARFDHNSRFGSSFNPRLGVVFKLSETSTLKVLYGKAFRAPTPSESYTQYGSFYTLDSGRTYNSNFLHLPNTGLKPVRTHNAEINFQKEFSNNLVLSVDGYYSFITGLYAFADDNATTKIYNNNFNGIPIEYIEVFVNNDRQKNFGGNIQLRWKKSFPKWTMNTQVALSYVNGVKEQGLRERDETMKDLQLDFIAPVMVHFLTDIKTGKFSFSPRLLVMGGQHIAGIADKTKNIIHRQTIGGYALLNIAARYQLSQRMTFFANVHNALDQRYRTVSFNMDLTKTETELYHGQPQDPIRISTGINFTF